MTSKYEGNEVEIVEEPLTAEAFQTRFAQIGKPALFRNFLAWPAFERWTFDELRRRLSGVAGGTTGVEDVQYFDLGTYAACLGTHAQMSIYAAQQGLPTALQDDCPTPAHIPPEQIQRVRLWMGSTDSATPLHADGYHNLIVVVRGEKRFQIVPRTCEAVPLAPQANAVFGFYSAVDLISEGHGREAMPAGVEVLDVTVREGEAFFLPNYWWHAVTNPSPSVMVQHWWRSPDHLFASPVLDMGLFEDADVLYALDSGLEVQGKQDDLALMERALKMALPRAALLLAGRWLTDVLGTEQSTEPALQSKLEGLEKTVQSALRGPDAPDEDVAETVRAQLTRIRGQLPDHARPRRVHDETARSMERDDLIDRRGSQIGVDLTSRLADLRSKIERASAHGTTFQSTFLVPALVTWQIKQSGPSWELHTTGAEEGDGLVFEDEQDLPFLLGLSLFASFDSDDIVGWYAAVQMDPPQEALESYIPILLEDGLLTMQG